MFIGRTDFEAETPILWPPDKKNWLIWKDPDAGKDWRQEEKGMTEDEMVGWHHWLNGHEFEWTPGVGDGQGGLVCCSPRGHKESDTTEWLNWLKSLQSCLTLCDSMDCSPPGSSLQGDLRGKNAGVGHHALLYASSQTRDRTHFCYVSCIGRWILLPLVPPGRPNLYYKWTSLKN